MINAFRNITGIPILLNTSFNNNAEPIVDSINDAVVCFLTTKLNYLVVGDFLVSKKDPAAISILSLAPSLQPHNKLVQTKKFFSPSQMATVFEIANTYDERRRVIVSWEAFSLLSKTDVPELWVNCSPKKTSRTPRE